MKVEDIKKIAEETNIYDAVEKIKVKETISFIERKIICDDVVNACLKVNEEGFSYCDYFIREIVFALKVVTYYTNIEIDEERKVEEYDYLYDNDLLDHILNNIRHSEYKNLVNTMDNLIEDRVQIDNSLGNILAKTLQELASKAPSQKDMKKMMNDIPKLVNKINPDNLEIFKNMFTKKEDE